MTAPVRVRMTKLDRAYEACREEIAETLADPRPGTRSTYPSAS